MSDDNAEQEMARLESYLTEHLGEEIVDTSVLAEGLNRLIQISTVNDPQAYVVRQPNKSRGDEGFTDIATEHTVMERLEPTDVPVPEAIHFCGDESVLGSPFSVIEHVSGTPLNWDESLPEGFRTAQSRKQLGTVLVDTLVDLHTVDTEPFAEICEAVDPQTQVDRDIAQLERATSVTGHDSETLWRVADWLQANAPDRKASTLVHGDYKPDNVLYTWENGPQISAVIDWETAKLRDPRTELGYLLFYWREADDPSPALAELAARHPESAIEEIRERERTGFWPFTKRQGTPSREELVTRWENATERTYDNDRFYRAFGAFMLATVWEGLYADELTRGEDVSGWEAHIEYVAELAYSVTREEFPL